MKLLVLGLLVSGSAFAATPATYIVQGKSVNASDALRAAIDGQPVTQCSAVVLQPNKTGTGFTFKKPKKTVMADKD